MTITLSGSALATLDGDLVRRAAAAVPRLAAHDATLWGPKAEAEAAVRLGWIDLPESARSLLPALKALVEARKDLTNVLLCGMGGSSLAPEVIAASTGRPLTVVDSTDPAQVQRAAQTLRNSVIIIASKSGSTIETDAHRRVFRQALIDAGLDPARHLVVVTDPGSPLETESLSEGVSVIHGDSHVGGRFSALSAFGLTPTALLGLDPDALLAEARAVRPVLAGPDSPAVALAVAMAQHRWMTLATTDSRMRGIGEWIEQLVAESTGKEGVGLLPIVVEDDTSSDFRGADRLSVAMGPSDHADLSIQAPLGAAFLLWEWATALAGHLLGIDPFNQPNVAESKANTSALLEEWGPAGAPAAEPDGVDGPVEVFGAPDIASALRTLRASNPEYLAVMAYLDRESDQAAAQLRALLSRHFPVVTFGWGPRFLHSTGQFHKGGPQTGAFLQITGATSDAVPVPGRPYDLATLQLAQALGDVRALTSRSRPVIRLHLTDRAAGIARLRSVALSL